MSYNCPVRYRGHGISGSVSWIAPHVISAWKKSLLRIAQAVLALVEHYSPISVIVSVTSASKQPAVRLASVSALQVSFHIHLKNTYAYAPTVTVL